MIIVLTKIKNIVLDILFPPICLNCQKNIGGGNKSICENCFSSIKINNTLFCPVCRARLAENKKICHFNGQYLLAAAGNYDDPALKNLIHYFKYKSFQNLAPILGEILLKYIEDCRLKIENFIVVPIPLHPRRQRERGFNQAKILAEIAAKNFDLDLIEPLKRVKYTKPQSQIKNNESRQSNVFNCFQIENRESVKGKRIILVDDVFTSGATINEAVKVLKINGAKQIIVLVLAKA